MNIKDAAIAMINGATITDNMGVRWRCINFHFEHEIYSKKKSRWIWLDYQLPWGAWE